MPTTGYQVCLISAVLLVTSAQSNTTHNCSCVGQYEEFLKKTFPDDGYSQNRFTLKKTFYLPSGQKPFSVQVTYQTLLPNGSLVNIVTQDTIYNFTVWIWLSSPLFLVGRPESIDRVSFYVLNNFKKSKEPRINLTVPQPCPNFQFEFLQHMTMSLMTYASEKTKHNSRLGNVEVIAEGPPQFRYMPWDPINTQEAYNHFVLMVVLGNLIQLAAIWVAITFVLSEKLNIFVQHMEDLSYQYYGLAYGWTAAAFGLIIGLLVLNGRSFADSPVVISIEMARHVLLAFGIVLGSLPGIPIAAYFAYKTKAPPIPYALLLPAALLCCCKTRPVRSMIFGILLWINMVGAQCIGFQIWVFVAITLVFPLQIITNVILLVLILFCFINIIALVCTVSAYIFTPKRQRLPGGKTVMIKAILLILLLFTVSCYSSVLATGLGTFLNNQHTNEIKVLTVIGSAMVSITLGTLSFGLKHLVIKAVKVQPKANGDQDKDNIMLRPLENNSYEDY